MRTLGTLARGILRIDRYHGYAIKPRFIFDLASQIGERPIIQSVPLVFTNRDPVANIGKIFQCDSSTGVFGLLHKTFRNNVVLQFLVTLLFTGELFEFAFCRFRSLPLQIASAMRKGLADTLNILAGELFAVRIGYDVDDAKIYAKDVLWVNKIGFFNITNAVKEELFSHVKKFYFTLPVLEHLSLPIAHYEWNGQPTFNRPNGDEIILLKADDTVVIGDGSKWAELPLNLCVDLVGIRNFGNSSNDDLSREAERIPNGVICELVKVELFERLGLKCLFRDPITRFVDGFHRLKQSFSLELKRFQFNVNYQLHK